MARRILLNKYWKGGQVWGGKSRRQKATFEQSFKGMTQILVHLELGYYRRKEPHEKSHGDTHLMSWFSAVGTHLGRKES